MLPRSINVNLVYVKYHLFLLWNKEKVSNRYNPKEEAGLIWTYAVRNKNSVPLLIFLLLSFQQHFLFYIL